MASIKKYLANQRLLFCIIFVIGIFFVLPASASAADRYWVGGTGNWDASTTTHWSTSSGGSGGASVPTSSDNVIFDNASSTSNAAYTVTLTAESNANNFTMDGPGAGNKVTFAGVQRVNVYGNFNMAGGTSGITQGITNNISFKPASGTKTAISNGLSFNYFIFSGAGTTQLLDDMTISGTGSVFLLQSGNFDPNGHAVVFTGSPVITGSLTFYDLTVTPTPAKTNSLTFANNVTITNTFTINSGATVTNRVIVKSNTMGTPITITSASNSFNNVDFQDITGAGAANWDLSAISGLSGDAGGNSGITFTTSSTQTATGTASFTWSTHGWTTRVPLPQDDVVINNAFSAGRTITMDMPRAGRSITFNCTGSPTFTPSVSYAIFGSLNLTGVGSIGGSSTPTFSGRSSYTITSSGLTFPSGIILDAPGGTYTLQDNFAIGTSSTFSLTRGTFDANGYDVSIGVLANSNSNVRGLIMGSGTWSLTTTSATTVWSMFSQTNLTFNAGTSTIKVTSTTNTAVSFSGGGATFNNIWFARGASTSSVTIAGSNTFNNFKDTGTAAHSILFTTGTTQTVSSWTVNGTAGNEITINSTTTGTHALTKSGGGVISSDYLNIQHSVATPSSTWYAGLNSTNNQSTATAGSGWVFNTPLPGAPTSLSATYGNAQVDLSWVAPVYTGSGSVSDYVIEYKLTSDSSWSIFSDGVSTTTSGSVTGLVNGSSYDFRVSAVNNAGQGSASSTATATPKTVPGAPTIGTATGGNAQASVTFSAPGSNGGSAITSYTVTSSPGSITGTGSSSPITVTGLTNGTSYTFTVTATNVVGTGSASSASNSVTPATVPGAPTFVTPVEGDTQVALSWTAPADDGGASVTDYVVEYKLTSDVGWLTFTDGTSASTSATVTGLVNGSSYDFRISAVNSAGQGSASSTATATPKTVPGAPTIGTATGGNAQASVTFSAPGSNGGSAITSYTVTSSPGGLTGTGASSPITVTGLTNGTAYTFTVTATNVVGTGSASSASNSVTPATVPGAPTIGTATAGNAQASVTFSAPGSNGGSAITSYTVTSSPGSITGTGASSPITVTGLTSGASYTFSVTATNSVGTGASSGDTAPITIPVEPDAPVNLAASVQGSAMSLSWSAPADDGGLPLTDYVVEYQLTTGGVWSVFADGTSTLTTATVTGLSNGTSYDFRVRAVNAVGQSVPSDSVTAIPGEPAQVLIQSFPDLTTTTIGTAVRITNEGSIAFEYQYTWCITDATDNNCGGGNDEFSSTAAKLINASENWDTTLNSTLLTPGVYYFHIEVTFGSETSSAVQSFTAVATFPDAPTIGTATGGNAQASVTFSAPGSNGGSAITSYTVTSSPGSITGTGSSSPITVTGLTNGTSYTFTVTATNVVGTGSASSASNSVTPATVPGAPTGVTATAGNGQVSLTWLAPSDDGGSSITDYVIEYKLTSDISWLVFADGTSTNLSATVTGLTNGLSYDFRVSAVNGVGQSVIESTNGTPAGGNNGSSGGGTSGSMPRTVNDQPVTEIPVVINDDQSSSPTPSSTTQKNNSISGQDTQEIKTQNQASATPSEKIINDYLKFSNPVSINEPGGVFSSGWTIFFILLVILGLIIYFIFFRVY